MGTPVRPLGGKDREVATVEVGGELLGCELVLCTVR
jgi:hypothetical protein